MNLGKNRDFLDSLGCVPCLAWYNRRMATLQNSSDALSGALLASKSILARLLASENITVEHQPVQTAAFDVENRVLTLPMWERMSNELYDMLVGHEVAHALFTPPGGDALMSAIDAVDRGNGRKAQAKDCLNIIEDARIERMMKDRFPGLIRDFDRGYREMHADGIFDLDGQDVSKMGLADRINLHFKLGHILDIPFDDAEQKLVDAITDSDSFDDVIELSKTLFDLTDGERESEEQDESGQSAPGMGSDDDSGQEQDSPAGDDGDDVDSGDSDDSGSATAMGDDGNTETNTDNSTGETDIQPEGDGVSSGDEGGSDSPIKTAGSLERFSQDRASNDTISRRYVKVPDLDYDAMIVKPDTIASDFEPAAWIPFTNETDEILRDANRIAANMAKRFEMKQSAKQARRERVAKTGVIDTVRMMSYKYNEDIFRRNTILPKGKNHGMVMMVDWSGSMHECMSDTLLQALYMAVFCRKIGIPFSVYGFTSYTRFENRGSWMSPCGTYNIDAHKNNDFVQVPRDFQLLELLSSNQRSGEFKTSLLNVARMILSFRSHMRSWGNKHYPTLSRELSLGGTPLNQAILASRGLSDRMRRAGVEIVNLVFLTDGASNGGPCHFEVDPDESDRLRSYWNATPIIVGRNKQQYAINPGTETHQLLKWLGEDTGSRTIGFFLYDGKNYYTGNPKTDEIFATEKFVHLGTHSGYDDYFVMNPKTTRKSTTLFDDLDDDVSARRTATAFIKQQKAKAVTKNLMNQFAELVAQSS